MASPIEEQVIDFYGALFDRIFAGPLQSQVTQLVRRRAVTRQIQESASHPSGMENRPDNRWGYGLIQPVEALKALG